MSELRRDWLVGNSVLALLAASMIAQTWGPSGGTYEFPGNISAPTFPEPVSLGVAAFLFVLSPCLAAASMVEKLRTATVLAVLSLAPMMAFFAWLLFTVSSLAIVSELPEGVWWAQTLAWGGLVMFFFLFVRFLHELWRSIGASRPSRKGSRREAPHRESLPR